MEVSESQSSNDGPPATRTRAALAASREERQRQQAKEIADSIRHGVWTFIWWLVAAVLMRTRYANLAAVDEPTRLPVWYLIILRRWNAQYRAHWQRWKDVATFAVILCAILLFWGPLKRFVLSGYIPKSAHAPVVTHARAIQNPETFVNGYMTYVPFGALLDAYATMDQESLLKRIAELTNRHLAQLEGGSPSGDRDLDDNQVDDDLELQALKMALHTIGADMAKYAEAPPEIAIAMGPVCGYVTQLEDDQFHVRRLCWDLLNVMLDTTYYPQGIVNRILNANYKNNPALEKTIKERMELVHRNKELPNTKNNMLQGMPPCVCLHHLGFVESGAYTVMPDGRSKLFLNPRISSSITEEERAHNRRHAFVTEMRPPHEEIETVDRAFWSILGESPRLQQNAWLKMDYWTLPDASDLECFYGRDLGTPEKALLFAESYITQQMRNYEKGNNQSSSRQEGAFNYIEWINSISHAYHQKDRKAMMAHAYEKAVELRLDMKFIQEAHEREQRAQERASNAGQESDQGWLGRALKGAGIPLGGFGRNGGGSGSEHVCSAESRHQEPRLIHVQGDRVEAPQSQCNLHCIHLHNTHERRRTQVFKQALEQHKQMNEHAQRQHRASISSEHVAAEKKAEEDVDDYKSDMF